MKKLLSMALVLAMLLSLSVPAFAADAEYNNTQAFLNDMKNEEGFTLDLAGVTDFAGEKYEEVDVSYKGELSKYTSNFSVFFNQDEKDIVYYMGQVIKFDESKLSDVLAEVNRINAQTTGLKLYVDTSDNTVSAELFLLVTKESAADLSLYGIGFFIAYTDGLYERLKDYSV